MKSKSFFMGATMAALMLAVMGRGVLAAPANANFQDEAFYGCVVSAYNTSTGSSMAATTSLTDAQLAKVTTFDGCPTQSGVGTTAIYPAFTNLAGIEKLKGVTSMTIKTSGVAVQNFGNMPGLKTLTIMSDDLQGVVVTSNTELKQLNLYDTKIETLNVTGLDDLEVLLIPNALVDAGLVATEENGWYEIDLSGLGFLTGTTVSVNVGEMRPSTNPAGEKIYTYYTDDLEGLGGVLPIAVTTTVDGSTRTLSYRLKVPTEATYMPEASSPDEEMPAPDTPTTPAPDTGRFPIEINAVAAGVVGAGLITMGGWFAYRKFSGAKVKVDFKK